MEEGFGNHVWRNCCSNDGRPRHFYGHISGQCMGGQWAVKCKEPIKACTFSTRQLCKKCFRLISRTSRASCWLFSSTHYKQLLNEAEYHLKNFGHRGRRYRLRRITPSKI